MRRSRRILLVAALVVALVVVGVLRHRGGGRNPGVTPRTPMEVVVQDDAQMLHQSNAGVRRTAETLARLGADRVRITASWSALAPDPRSPARPRFDASDPGAYPAGGFALLDRAVREANRAGLGVMIDLAFWAPRWAVANGTGGPDRTRWLPSPHEFGLFARAVARRYDGDFTDPVTGAKLPAVRLWTTWNEPNHSAFLLPQWERRDGSWVPASPHEYRALHVAAYGALKAVDPANRVLIGGLTSKGGGPPGPYSSITPLRFVRELACVDARLRPLRRPECRGFRPLQADGFAIHPYSFSYGPAQRSPNPEWVTLADLDRLSSLLRALSERGRIAHALPLYITEYGFETNPPDPYRGIPLARQAAWMSEAAAIAHARPDTRMFAQFLLRDIGPDLSVPPRSPARWGGYQTGIEFADGRPKPSFAAFALPLYAARSGGEVIASGQLRPGHGRQRLVLERRIPGGGWRAAGPVFSTDPFGFFRRPLPGPGTYRARQPGGGFASLPVTVP